MSLRCKPGDLAFIVESDAPQNLHKVVRVIERTRDWDGLPAWEVRSEGSPLIGFDNIMGWPCPVMACRAPDRALRPIRGDEPVGAAPITVESPAPCFA